MTNRITPELVQAAYHVTGLQPVMGVWGLLVVGTACPLSAVCVAAEAGHPCSREDPYEYVAERLGLSVDYVLGYTAATDDLGCQLDQFGPDYVLGYADGAAAAAVVFGEAQ